MDDLSTFNDVECPTNYILSDYYYVLGKDGQKLQIKYSCITSNTIHSCDDSWSHNEIHEFTSETDDFWKTIIMLKFLTSDYSHVLSAIRYRNSGTSYWAEFKKCKITGNMTARIENESYHVKGIDLTKKFKNLLNFPIYSYNNSGISQINYYFGSVYNTSVTNSFFR